MENNLKKKEWQEKYFAFGVSKSPELEKGLGFSAVCDWKSNAACVSPQTIASLQREYGLLGATKADLSGWACGYLGKKMTLVKKRVAAAYSQPEACG